MTLPRNSANRVLAIPDDQLRAAIAYARSSSAPLLTRLRAPLPNELVVVGWHEGGGSYQLVAEDVANGVAPRWVHLAWLSQALSDEEPLDLLERTVGDSYVESLRDDALHGHGTFRGLDERTYARVYGGPVHGKDEELQLWLHERVDIFALEGDADGERLLDFIEAHDPASDALAKLLAMLHDVMPWRDPDTGEEVGRISEAGAPGYGITRYATTHVALTCLQWTADRLDVLLRFEVQEA